MAANANANANSLANFCHQISNKKLRIMRCKGIPIANANGSAKEIKKMSSSLWTFFCEWTFATKFASDCECDGLVHSALVWCGPWCLQKCSRQVRIVIKIYPLIKNIVHSKYPKCFLFFATNMLFMRNSSKHPSFLKISVSLQNN